MKIREKNIKEEQEKRNSVVAIKPREKKKKEDK